MTTEAVSGPRVGEVASPASPSGTDSEIETDSNDAAGHAGDEARRPGFRARAWAAMPRDPVLLVAAALLLVPALAAMYSARVHPWYPTNDWALIELQVRDVFTSDTPLLGAWSRFNWRHPGPLSFYLLALPYRLAPPDRGLLFATTVVNFGFVASYAWVALRQPRWRALVALGGLALLQRGLGIEGLTDPWNPTTPIIPFALYVLLCVDLATARRRWTLPAIAFVASLVVQSHIGFAQPTLLVGAAALVLRVRWERREAAGDEPAEVVPTPRMPTARAPGARPPARGGGPAASGGSAGRPASPPRSWRRCAGYPWPSTSSSGRGTSRGSCAGPSATTSRAAWASSRRRR